MKVEGKRANVLEAKKKILEVLETRVRVLIFDFQFFLAIYRWEYNFTCLRQLLPLHPKRMIVKEKLKDGRTSLAVAVCVYGLGIKLHLVMT